MKNLFAIMILVMFSSSVLAQEVTATGDGSGAAGANAEATNTADSSNNGSNVNITFEAEEDTRGIDSPIQTHNQSDVHYSGEYDVRTVPNVSAPGLTTTLTETCMGSTSAGAGWVGFGFSFGTTWRDSACVRRLDARQLSAIGYNLGAKELMCDSDAVREALKRAGKPCFVDLPEEVREVVNPDANADIIKAEQVTAGAGGAGEDGEGW